MAEAEVDEEEIINEVEAVQSVYSHDCWVVQSFPPHLQVHIKPRTAEDSSQQFVEVVLGLKAGPQYPKEPPHIEIIESKGLDEKRQVHLINSILEKACDLSSCLMLVALCEEAVDMLSNMNHPDGNCPLCLFPLVEEDAEQTSLPFMKLMSCFHCFHSECISRWWKWIHDQKETNPDFTGTMKENLGKCPVCRMVFHARDIEHVLDLVGTHPSQLCVEGTISEHDDEFLQSESECIRREKFQSLLKLQEENNGLIEPKKFEVLQPGQFLPEPAITLPTVSTKSIIEQEQKNPVQPLTSETSSSGSFRKPGSTSERKNVGRRTNNRPKNPGTLLAESITPPSGSTKSISEQQQTNPFRTPTSETSSSRSLEKPGTGEHKNVGRRTNNRPKNPGTVLAESITPPTVSTKYISQQQQTNPIRTLTSETSSSRSLEKPGTGEHKNVGRRTNNRPKNPGTVLAESITPPTVSTKSISQQQQTNPIRTPTSETSSSRSMEKPGTGEHKNLGMRTNNRARNPRQHKKEWTRKEAGNTD